MNVVLLLLKWFNPRVEARKSISVKKNNHGILRKKQHRGTYYTSLAYGYIFLLHRILFTASEMLWNLQPSTRLETWYFFRDSVTPHRANKTWLFSKSFDLLYWNTFLAFQILLSMSLNCFPKSNTIKGAENSGPK